MKKKLKKKITPKSSYFEEKKKARVIIVFIDGKFLEVTKTKKHDSKKFLLLAMSKTRGQIWLIPLGDDRTVCLAHKIEKTRRRLEYQSEDRE
jgi:hypothetical protein